MTVTIHVRFSTLSALAFALPARQCTFGCISFSAPLHFADMVVTLFSRIGGLPRFHPTFSSQGPLQIAYGRTALVPSPLPGVEELHDAFWILAC